MNTPSTGNTTTSTSQEPSLSSSASSSSSHPQSMPPSHQSQNTSVPFYLQATNQSLELPHSSFQPGGKNSSRSPSLPPLPMAASPIHFNSIPATAFPSLAGLSPAMIAALATSAGSPAGAAEAVAEAAAYQTTNAAGEPIYPFYLGNQGAGMAGHNGGAGISGRAASLPGGGSVGGSPSSLASPGGSNFRGRAHSGLHSSMMAEGGAQNLHLNLVNAGYGSHSTSLRSPQMRASFGGNGNYSSTYHNNSNSNHQHYNSPNGFGGNSNNSHSLSHSSNSTSYVPQHPPAFSGTHHHPPNYERHTSELTSCIIAFLGPILPTEEEYRIKEATRRQLERLAGKVSPGAKLLAFGSMANGFALRNSGEFRTLRSLSQVTVLTSTISAFYSLPNRHGFVLSYQQERSCFTCCRERKGERERQ